MDQQKTVTQTKVSQNEIEYSQLYKDIIAAAVNTMKGKTGDLNDYKNNCGFCAKLTEASKFLYGDLLKKGIRAKGDAGDEELIDKAFKDNKIDTSDKKMDFIMRSNLHTALRGGINTAIQTQNESETKQVKPATAIKLTRPKDVMIETKPTEQPIAQAMGNKARKVAQEPDIDTLIARKQEQDAAIRKKLGPVFK